MTPGNPAAALQAHLGSGKWGDGKRVAAIVGELGPVWSDYCAGKRTPSTGKLKKWCAAAGVWVVCTGHSWTVTKAPGGQDE